MSNDSQGPNVKAWVRPQADIDAARWEAIRQAVPCPTCVGHKQVHCTGPKFTGGTCYGMHMGHPCPDCTDGKIDMARLLAVGAAVFADNLPLETSYNTIVALRQVRP